MNRSGRRSIGRSAGKAAADVIFDRLAEKGDEMQQEFARLAREEVDEWKDLARGYRDRLIAVGEDIDKDEILDSMDRGRSTIGRLFRENRKLWFPVIIAFLLGMAMMKIASVAKLPERPTGEELSMPAPRTPVDRSEYTNEALERGLSQQLQKRKR